MMRTIYRKDGIKLNGQGFVTIGDMQYPSAKDAFERGANGVTQAQVDDYPDLNFFTVTEDLAGNLTITPKSQIQLDAFYNLQIQQQIDALERAEMNPRDTRETKISYAEFMATNMGAAASSTFTLAQFNQVVAALGIVLTTEQQTSVTNGIVPPLTPAQSVEIAYATNIAYRKNIDFDNQIKALRAQLI